MATKAIDPSAYRSWLDHATALELDPASPELFQAHVKWFSGQNGSTRRGRPPAAIENGHSNGSVLGPTEIIPVGAETVQAAPKRRGRPPGSGNKPKPADEAEPVKRGRGRPPATPRPAVDAPF